MERYIGIHSAAELQKIISDNESSDHGLERAGMRIDRILHRLTGSRFGYGDWSQLKGLTVLDLGCGSESYVKGGVYEPHLPRLLSENGAVVTGMDIGANRPSTGSDYTHIQIDIFDRILAGSLAGVEGIQGKTFDVINSMGFIGNAPAPALFDRLIGPELRDVSGFSNKRERFFELLLEQLKPLTHPGSLLMLDSRHFKNRDGALKELPSIGE